MNTENLRIALSPRFHSPLLARRRAAAIVALAGSFAALFAGLTIGWIAVDAAAFPPALWHPLAGARLAAAAAFLLLARACRGAPASMAAAHARLAMLCLIPAVFHVATHDWLAAAPAGTLAQQVASVYSLVPFVIAGGLAVFPLAAVESAAYSLIAFVLLALTGPVPARVLGAAPAVDEYWLLFLTGGIAGFAGMSQVRLFAALIRQATRDPLTKCLRRESGRDLLEHQFRLSQRQAAPFAVLFADLDHFKAVNDTWGHEVGDRVLADSAAALREACRGSDAVLRWGGEEFVVLLPGATAADATRLLERLRSGTGVRLPDGRRMTFSIGAAERLRDGVEDPGRLVKLADRRMYRAKDAGRNRWLASDDPADAAVLLPVVPA